MRRPGTHTRTSTTIAWKICVPPALARPAALRRATPALRLLRLLRICLAIIVTWHFMYVPLHLLAHDHLDGAASTSQLPAQPETHTALADASCDHDNHTKHDDSHHHEPHPVTDHLAGFWSVTTPPITIDPIHVSINETAERPAVAPVQSVSRAHLRGPPSGAFIHTI